jgi:hypothetical protein
MANAKVTGNCLCGAVQYQIAGSLKQVVGCHCTMCRKQTGHYLAFTAAWKEHVTIANDDALKWCQSSDDSRRGFCSECGSILFFETEDDDKISIAAGSLNGNTDLNLVAHIFVADKGDYYTIDDSCPQYPAGGDNVPMPAKA